VFDATVGNFIGSEPPVSNELNAAANDAAALGGNPAEAKAVKEDVPADNFAERLVISILEVA
jgi:hypothetical protein